MSLPLSLNFRFCQSTDGKSAISSAGSRRHRFGTAGRLSDTCKATFGREIKEGQKKPFRPVKEVHNQATHTIVPEKLEILKTMENWAETDMLKYLKPVEKSWKPQDFLPSPDSEGFYDQIKELKDITKDIPDEYFVVLVGGMITEEALPTYQSALNTLDGIRDETGASLSPWAVWIRAWTAEENRHGDLLNKYLYLSGRVDMRAVEKTIQYLIGSGMDTKFENNPYYGFIYTSFQERATFISHGNTAKLAKLHGDETLARICGTIAADEKRHEAAYTKVVEKLFELDPNDTVLALAHMMRNTISMPAQLMPNEVFEEYSAVAQRIGVYTAADYAAIMDFLLQRWDVPNLSQGLSGEGRRARDFLCGLPHRIRRLDERRMVKHAASRSTRSVSFSWVFDKLVQL